MRRLVMLVLALTAVGCGGSSEEATTDKGTTAVVSTDAEAAGQPDAVTAPGPAAALPDHTEAGTPLDAPFTLDVADTGGFGTANSSCTASFVAASGLDASVADCIHVTSALSDWVAVIATTSAEQELWMACSDGTGGFTFGLRWAGTVMGVTPIDDAVAGSAVVVSLSDAAGVNYHVVIWDQYEGAPCPTSTVEFPGTAGTGPIVQAAGVYLSLDGSEPGSKGVCYRPENGVWTRGSAENGAC